MLPVVSISAVCSGLPIFDLIGLCEPLHAHVQVSVLQTISPPFVDVLPALRSSLVTGSRSHKLVTSDVSRILWYYYNDSVSVFFESNSTAC